ncbi:MAG TPA: response regulator, partial [Anaerolineae bacterium]|nr:response regulator [Anaerolineae bacterium]
RQYRTLAAQAATVLENRRLFENVEARVNELSVLTRIGRRIASTLDLHEVLSLIVEETIGTTKATQASIALYNETENALEVRVMRGYAPEIETNTLGMLIQPGQGLHGRLLITGQSVLMNDVRIDPDYMDVNSDTRSEFIIPIRQGDLLLGALNLESPTVSAFDEADRRLIEALADQAAVAITNARSYEAERKAVERMREVDRLKTQFLANMSHELRTPLNSIIGFSRVIMRGIDGPLTELQMTDLQSIYNSGQHLLGLINNILDISKIEAGKMELANEPIDLRDIARGVMSTVSALIKDKSVKLEQEIPDNLPPITADSTRVRQIMLNLMSNAAKFTEQGKITLRVVTNPREVQVSVIDTGIGIPANKLEHIFEEFTQVDASTTRRVGGTGLGLAITRRFVEMHGGRIWVESQLSVGSTFTFTLPLHIPEEPPERVSLPIDLAARDAGKKVILSIDDDPGVITLYKRYLDKQGYLVIGLTDPSKAVDEAKRLLPFAITLDIMMPSRDGWSLLADLKSTPEINRVPIVVCSILQDKTKGYSLGATEYLVKPITEDELLHALDRVSRHNIIRNVLVIDDEPTGIQLIKRILEVNGNYQILEASGGAEGIARVEFDRPDLIILDLMMPDVDGFTVLETIKSSAATRRIPVIVVTAKEITREDRDRLNGHAVALFNKGMFTADQLLTELIGALKQLNGAEVVNPDTK